MDMHVLLKEIKVRLQRTHGDRLQGVVLFGSAARSEVSEDSDIDVLVLLKGPIKLGRDLQRNIDALYPLSLEIGCPISAKPVDGRHYDEYDCPLFDSAKKEGIQI